MRAHRAQWTETGRVVAENRFTTSSAFGQHGVVFVVAVQFAHERDHFVETFNTLRHRHVGVGSLRIRH
jgi:hypothetical protein